MIKKMDWNGLKRLTHQRTVLLQNGFFWVPFPNFPAKKIQPVWFYPTLYLVSYSDIQLFRSLSLQLKIYMNYGKHLNRKIFICNLQKFPIWLNFSKNKLTVNVQQINRFVTDFYCFLLALPNNNHIFNC